MPVPILTTKLFIPSPKSKVVLRPRLLEKLNLGLQRKLTLVSAPAGFGKTTLVSEWIHQKKDHAGIEVAWLSLDADDNDPTGFLLYIIAALQTLWPEIGGDIFASLQSPQPPPLEAVLPNLLNEITTVSQSFALVFDDYHVIENQAINQALAFLLEHQPVQMHLVIVSREDPDLPVARLRARAQLIELRAADLRFSSAEAADFLNQVMGLNLVPEDICALEKRTEGWIAGLQLAGLSVQGHKDVSGFIRNFTGSHHFVLDYLLEEVLHQQSERIKAFMLRTSILERFCGSLCEAVAGDSSGSGQETLEYLERTNLFIVPLDSKRVWYRYHHLFRDLLRQRLEQNYTFGEIAELHTHASGWYETNGLAFDAFRHAVAANDVARAERLIESSEIGLHFHSVTIPVLNWLISLPKRVLDIRPKLWVRSATLALMAGQTAGVEERLKSAENALQTAELDDQTRDLIGQIACARATLALTHYDPQTMLTQARRAIEYLHPDNVSFLFIANWALATALMFQGNRTEAARVCRKSIAISEKSGDIFSRILAVSALGEVQELENKLYQAAETYQQVLELSGEFPQPNAAEAHLGLARIYYEWNNLNAAEKHGQESLRLARQYDRVIDRFIISEVFLAQMKRARGDLDGAATNLAEIERTARQKNFTLRLPEIAAAQVPVLLQQGNWAKAVGLVEQYELPLSKARIHLAKGETDQALKIIEQFRLEIESKNWPDERLKAMVLQSIALYVNGDKDQAVHLLCEVLTLAEPGGFIRTFVDEGVPMAQLLQEVDDESEVLRYARLLLDKFPSNQNQQTLPVSRQLVSVESLSKREIEVLQHIAQGLTNDEIATRLYISLYTVKAHVRNIFRKLGVSNRTQAVNRARELGILQSS